MKMRTKAKILSGLLALSGLCMSGNAFAHPPNSTVPTSIVSTIPTPTLNYRTKPLTPEKKLELQMQKLDLEYEADRLREEDMELAKESQKIKDELDGICVLVEFRTSFTNLSEKAILERFDKCLKHRRMYHEKLSALYLKLDDWKNRACKFSSEVIKYGNSDDLLLKKSINLPWHSYLMNKKFS